MSHMAALGIFAGVLLVLVVTCIVLTVSRNRWRRTLLAKGVGCVPERACADGRRCAMHDTVWQWYRKTAVR